MLPWIEMPLGELLEVQNGNAFSSKQFSSTEGMPLIRIRDLSPGTQAETNYTGDYDAKYLVHEGDMLIGMDGEFRCRIWRGPPALLNQRVCRLHSFSDALLPRFLHYGINKHLQDIEDATGFTTVKHLSSKAIKAIEFLLPPLPEQERIVAILDEAFAAIATATASAEKSLANARELFENYLNSIFTHEGDGWTKTILGDIATFKNGLNFTKSSKGEVVKIVGVRSFQSNYWVPMEELDTVQIDGPLSEAYTLRKNDILTVRSNGNRQLIGRCILAGDVPEKTSHSGFTIRIRVHSSGPDPAYLVHYLKSGAVRERLVRSGAGTSISSLSQKGLSILPVHLPGRDEQSQIVMCIEAVKTEAERLASIYQAKVDSLTELKQSILHKAFTGELTADFNAADVALSKGEV